MEEIRNRDRYHKKLLKTLFQVRHHHFQPLTSHLAATLYERSQQDMQQCEDFHTKALFKCADDDARDVQEKAFEPVEECYINVLAELKQLMESFYLAATSSSSTTTSSASKRRVRLPPIELPTFDGQYENWTSFHDLFSATIDSDTSLEDAEKLKYLKHSIKGDAANIIRAIAVTNANYAQAWKLLKDRYSNQREIVNSVLRRLFGQHNILKESATELQMLLDTTNECITNLKVLCRPVEHWDDILIHFTIDKLDSETRRHWAMTLTGTSLPTFTELQQFLEKPIRGLQASNATPHQAPVSSYPQKKMGNRQAVSAHHGSFNDKCEVCSSKHSHPIFKCKKFLSSSHQERKKQAHDAGVCFNCLRDDHRVDDCGTQSRCKTCGGKHHTLLHAERRIDAQPSSKPSQVTPSSSSGSSREFSTNISSSELEAYQVLLSTAVVKVEDKYGNHQFCRILLDSGLITEHCVNRLGLPRQPSKVTITGVTSSTETSRGEVSLRLCSAVNEKFIDVTAFVLPRVTGIQPKFECPHNFEHLRDVKLAEPLYYKPDKVDILVGADYLNDVIQQGFISGQPGSPSAHNSIFGWVLSGRVADGASSSIGIHVAECDTDKILRRFWEVEELPTEKQLTNEEEFCENHFKTTHSRNQDGRFIVQLPFNEKLSNLGSSKQIAFNRLRQAERRLLSHPEQKENYNKFMLEYEQLGHMDLLRDGEAGEKIGRTYYLPHHFVLKPDSTSTKFRVVFDGSAKTTTGISLNNCLQVGPVLHDDVFKILLRF